MLDGLFDMFSMMGNYEERKVENTIVNGATIDTARVTDAEKDFETGIMHPGFNGGKWIIVELYDTKEEAQEGHHKWVALFKKSIPIELSDVSTSSIAKLGMSFGVNINATYKNESLN
jgi:hypothetical protein